MKLFSPIFNIIAVVVFVMFAVIMVNITSAAEKDFDQARYNFAVQKATEAMFREALYSDNVDIDYTDLSYIEINASNVISVFDTVICANYDMSFSDDNFDIINQAIAACAITSYDGYYIIEDQPQEAPTTDYRRVAGYSKRFSPKIPYFYQDGSNVYAVDVYKHTHSSMPLNNAGANPRVYATGDTLPYGMNDNMLESLKNLQVTSALLNELNSSTTAKPIDIEKFRIAFGTETTKTGVNPIGTPGIIMFCTGVTYASRFELSYLAVAGYKAIQRTRVIGFYDKNTNDAYYCFEGQLLDEEKANRFVIEDFFSTATEAARSKSKHTGTYYMPYFDILFRRVVRDYS